MDESTEDQRLEHHRSPPKFIEIPDLCSSTGVEYFKVNFHSECKCQLELYGSKSLFSEFKLIFNALEPLILDKSQRF